MFDAFVTYHARFHPHRSALLTRTGAMSFAELETEIGRFAHALADLPRDAVVSVGIANPATHWLILLALARLGIASACAADAAATCRITDQPGTDGPPVAIHATDAWITAVTTSNATSLPTRPDQDRLGRVLLSSGTTGQAKRIGLSWRLINAAIRNTAIVHAQPHRGPWLIEPGADTVFGFTAMLSAWAAGQPLLLRHDSALEPLLARFEPAVVGMVPLQLQAALAQLSPGFRPYPLMRLVVTSGQLSPTLAREARRRLTHDIRIVYGASETGATAIADAAVLDRHRNAAGYAVPGAEIEIIDGAGHPLPPGQPGEVRMRSDRIVGFYLGLPDSPAFRHGWFYPGDLGRLLDDGLLLIDGRTDDVMNLGGIKLHATSVEQALETYPGLTECHVFAAPDADGNDECCIAVVPGPGFEQAELTAHLKRHLDTPARLRLIVMDRLPRTPTGKVERARLVALAHSARVQPD